MVDAPTIPTPPVNGPETTPNEKGDWALDKRVYRTLARSYITELQKQETRKKRVTSVSVAVLSTAFFITLIAIVYSVAR